MCGRLQWCPEMPLFFAVHELCTLMIPEIVTIDNPTPLGKELFQTDLKFLNQAFIRGRLLTCTTCREKGALVGCCFATCRSVFHLPCAIRSMCYINYEEFRSCLSSLGPDRYDDSDALNDAIYNPLEALNACISCGVHCHRICAGEPWSLYNPDDEGDEEMWQCEDCRDTLQTSAVKFTTPVSSVESTQTKKNLCIRANPHISIDMNMLDSFVLLVQQCLS
ncbi:hypothetical protein DICVIV_09511 [Dictyocaulus viviparus]|uniref:PHD-type domain-containing protein n=1 Tax=Dictyocaulus viviparus TaxID=29172 RepID=A0A0D8XL01_DICVI|nr:hypothetical protein DICVIV_09511 [Dictyocaulus viviparus]